MSDNNFSMLSGYIAQREIALRKLRGYAQMSRRFAINATSNSREVEVVLPALIGFGRRYRETIEYHKWLESEKAGGDIGWDAAVVFCETHNLLPRKAA